MPTGWSAGRYRFRIVGPACLVSRIISIDSTEFNTKIATMAKTAKSTIGRMTRKKNSIGRIGFDMVSAGCSALPAIIRSDGPTPEWPTGSLLDIRSVLARREITAPGNNDHDKKRNQNAGQEYKIQKPRHRHRHLHVHIGADLAPRRRADQQQRSARNQPQ